MIKPFVCYKKNCWSTDFSVLAEAALKEEEHFNEDLMARVTLHKHKGGMAIKEGNEVSEAISLIKGEKRHKSGEVYGKNEDNIFRAEYGLSEAYLGKVSDEKKTHMPIETDNKKVDGFVKLTVQKILKMGEYVMALTTPQWNKVTGSPEDKDTYAMTVSRKESISAENAQYEIGYNFLRYRD